jgi:hypothetical protein
LPGGHPTTDAILNDTAEVLRGLFVPWEKLASLLGESALIPEPSTNRYYRVWIATEPSFPSYIRTFASNLEMLQKSKEDCQLDALLRKQSAHELSFAIDEDLSDENPYPESDNETSCPDSNINETFSTETLLTAFSSISQLWDRELRDAQQRNTALAALSLRCLSLQLEHLQPLDIASNVLCKAALKYVLPQSSKGGRRLIET